LVTMLWSWLRLMNIFMAALVLPDKELNHGNYTRTTS
jgi:hypothetical protein